MKVPPAVRRSEFVARANGPLDDRLPQEATMDDARRRELIEQYRAGPKLLREAVAGLSPTELDHRPGEGEWTAREVVHHTADSEMTSGIRLRRLLAEDR